MRFVWVAFLLAGVVFLGPAVWAQPTEPLRIERERTLAIHGKVVQRSFPLFPTQPGVGRVFVQPITHNGATGLRLLFRITAGTPAPSWAIRVLDGQGSVAWTYSAAATAGPEFWSIGDQG